MKHHQLISRKPQAAQTALEVKIDFAVSLSTSLLGVFAAFADGLFIFLSKGVGGGGGASAS